MESATIEGCQRMSDAAGGSPSVVLEPSTAATVISAPGTSVRREGDAPALGRPEVERTPSRPPSLVSKAWKKGGFWAVPVVVAFALSVWHIGRPGLWRDELFTWDRSTLSLPDIVGVMHATDSVFVPYYLFMHGWIALFGTSPVALRMPSALAMTAAAGVVALLGRRLFTPSTGALAGLIFAFVPAVSRHGQEAKPHIFAALFVALATLLLVRALESPRWSRWVPYAAACTLVGFSHLLAFIMIIAHGVAVVALEWRRNRRAVAKWAIAATVAALPVSVLAAAGYAHRGPVAWLPLTTWQAMFDYPVRLTSGSIFNLRGAGVLAGLVLTLGFLAVLGNGRASWLLGTLALVPPAVLMLAGEFEHIYHPRYLLYTLVAWAVLAAATLVALRPALAIPLVVAIVLLGIPTQLVNRQSNGHGDDGVSTVAAILAGESRSGDGIMFQISAGDWFAIGTKYYSARVGDPAGNVSLRRLAHTAAECDSRQCPVDTPRVWVACLGRHTDALECLTPEQQAAVRRVYAATPVRVHRDPRFTLAVFQLGSPPS